MESIIAAGIVTYNPDINRLKDNIAAVITQVSSVIIVDNASDNIDEILSLTDDLSTVFCIRNKANYGIAKALNILFEECMRKGCKWVLTLDQDSVCPFNMVDVFKNYIDTNIAILCPRIIDVNVKNKEGENEKNNVFVKRCITSGSLTRIQAWNDVNGFDEKMFIDGVDHDFCDRLVRHGYYILQVNSVEMMHELGFTQMKKFFFLPVTVRNHTAFRKYYIAKNIIYLDKKNKCAAYPVSALLREIKLICIVLIYEKDKYHKVREIMRGIHDGFKESMQK